MNTDRRTDANVAAIDIGTNSVRLLVCDRGNTQLEREMRITRLGQGVDETGRLNPEAIQRTLNVLRDYAQRMQRHGIRALRVTATSAARDADNRADFFEAVQECLGQQPELLSGTEEAELSFTGAIHGLSVDTEQVVIFDIGGGSTELAVGSKTPSASISLDVGSVRITERFLRDDPPTRAQIRDALECVMQQLDRAAQALFPSGLLAPSGGAADPDSTTWIGLAGTVTSFAAHAAGAKQYDPKLTHGATLTARQVHEFSTTLLETPCEGRRLLLVEPQRAEVIVGGAIVLQALVDRFELERFRVSEHDILDGLAMSLL